MMATLVGASTKMKKVYGIISLVMFFLLATQAWSENIFYSDSNYGIIIAVTINSNDNIKGLWTVVWTEQVPSRSEAMFLEKRIKNRGVVRYLEGHSR